MKSNHRDEERKYINTTKTHLDFFFHAAGPYTVFAPTNKAFSLISRAELNGILNDPAKLTKLLQRHVVQDLIYTSGLQGFQKAYALDFEILYIYHAKGELFFLNEDNISLIKFNFLINTTTNC